MTDAIYESLPAEAAFLSTEGLYPNEYFNCEGLKFSGHTENNPYEVAFSTELGKVISVDVNTSEVVVHLSEARLEELVSEEGDSVARAFYILAWELLNAKGEIA